MAPTETIATSPVPADLDFKARWNAWQARGVAHERAVRRRLLIVVPVVALVSAVAAIFLMW